MGNSEEKGQETPQNVFEIIIGLTKEGQASIQIKGGGENNEQPNPYTLIGLLEHAKADLLGGLGERQAEGPLETIVLEEADFNLPGGDQLKSQGKKIGDQVQVPQVIAHARAEMLASMKGASAPEAVMKVVKDDVSTTTDDIESK